MKTCLTLQWFELGLFRFFLGCMKYRSRVLMALKLCLVLMKIFLFIPDPSLPRSPTVPTDGFISYGESSYSLVKLKLQWDEADDYCKLHTAHIASILDAYSNAFAWMHMQTLNEPVWIALNSNLVRCWKHV